MNVICDMQYWCSKRQKNVDAYWRESGLFGILYMVPIEVTHEMDG